MGTKIITDDYIFKAKVRFQDFVAARFGIGSGENPHHDLDAIKKIVKAWVNFNGTGTVAIRDSFNVSSITDEGTGHYKVNFTNAMPDINYSYTIGGTISTGGAIWAYIIPAQTTSALSIHTQFYDTTHTDALTVCVQIFGS